MNLFCVMLRKKFDYPNKWLNEFCYAKFFTHINLIVISHMNHKPNCWYSQSLVPE